MRVRVAVFWLLSLAVAGLDPSYGQDLAIYQIAPGWATFGVALPRGAARSGVQVGSLSTQTDVKTTWPDGSIRFAVVTAAVPSSASYSITPRPAATGTVLPPPLAASVALVIDGQTWTADLPQSSDDAWLAGPLVVERRSIVFPKASGLPHPFLTVVFDRRSYVDGANRIDVTVEDVLNVASADAVTYDVRISVAGQVVFQRAAVRHPYMARWRQVFPVNLREAAVTPDFRPFVAACAIPSYLRTITDPARSVTGTRFEILGVGDLHVPMYDHGGRAELAPYPDWTAQYLVHRHADQRAYVLAHGDLSGTWAIHMKEPDGIRLISIDDHPTFWLDVRADSSGRPKNNLRGLGLEGSNAHQPSLAFVPYLVTGDRYYLDEMKFWANYCLIATFQDSYYNLRQGSRGILAPNEVRGIGWTLRNLGDAAAYLPDTDPYKAYFTEKVQNNLEWLQNTVLPAATPLGTLFTGHRPEDANNPPYTWIALWEHTYVAWAIDRLIAHGFTTGGPVRDAVARFQLRLFTSDAAGYPLAYATPYVLAIGTVSKGVLTFFTTFRDVFRATYGNPPLEPVAAVDNYGVEARLMLLIARANGWERAVESYDNLMSAVSSYGVTMVEDVNRRSGWAIDRFGAAPQPPSSPKNVRVVR